MHLFPGLILSDATLVERLADGFAVTVVGMGCVIASLWILGEIFNLLRNLLTPTPVQPPVDERPFEPAAATVAEDEAASPAPAMDGRLIAILTAAAVAATGRAVVIRRVTFINRNTVSGWAEAGRTDIHTSHNFGRMG